jgi:two-component system, LytTR family, response regulator
VTLRAMVVDDEAVARRRVRRLLASEPDVTVAGEYGDGASALDAIVAGRPDLVFLDVQMPELDGFDLVRALGTEAMPAIVFVTAFDRYALQAFDVHAIDYLLKPFTPERFRAAVARARERITSRRAGGDIAALVCALRERPRHLSRVVVRTGAKLVVVDLGTVDWIASADNYVRLMAGGKEYLLRETLAGLEQQLDPDRFVRIHRSTIVRIDRIAELHPASHGDVDVVLRDGTRLSLSRTFRPRVEAGLKPRRRA